MNQEEQMKQIHDSIRMYMNLRHPDMIWFLSLHSSELSTYGGNACPRCAVESAIAWVEENQINHNKHDTETIQ